MRKVRIAWPGMTILRLDTLYCRSKITSKWLSSVALLALVIGVSAAIWLIVFGQAHVGPPDEPGPYSVANYTVSYGMSGYGTYEATIRYPVLNSSEAAQKDESNAPYPGIVVSSGLHGGEWSVSWISEHLTSHGYVTLGFTPPDPGLGVWTQWADGFTGGIQELKRQGNDSSSPIFGMLDFNTFGTIGLSMGGGGCIEAAGTAGSEVDAAVALAPGGYSSDRFAAGNVTSVMKAAANITVPIQLQVGSNDAMVPPERVYPFYSDLIPDTTVKQYVEIDGGNHIGFLNQEFAEVAEYIRQEMPDLAQMVGTDAPCEIGFEEQRRVSARYFTAWFQYHLKGITGYEQYIFGGGSAEENVSVLIYNRPQ